MSAGPQLRARSPRAALATVLVEGLLGRLAFGMVSFALPLYAFHLGLSLTQIGVLASLRSAFVLPLKPVAGWCVDRVGVRPVYLAGIALRSVSAVVLLAAGDFAGLLAVRALQGASAAARDVGSLSVIARDAEHRVGAQYGWYTSVRQVGNVAGAGLAGLLLATSGGDYDVLFLVVALLGVLPLAAAWYGLREGPASAPAAAPVEAPVAAVEPAPRGSWREELAGSLRGLGAASSAGMLIALSAYMVHGIWPVLATAYAGLTEAEAGMAYAISTAIFLVAGPAFGVLTDRGGRKLALALRSACNVGSSVLYVVWPSFAGMTVARCTDDAGKAAFKPAWASLVAEIAAEDPPRRGRRLANLDTATSVGEALGPIIAGLLWDAGGVVALFGVRILIAIVAEVVTVRVGHRRRPTVDAAPISVVATERPVPTPPADPRPRRAWLAAGGAAVAVAVVGIVGSRRRHGA